MFCVTGATLARLERANWFFLFEDIQLFNKNMSHISSQSKSNRATKNRRRKLKNFLHGWNCSSPVPYPDFFRSESYVYRSAATLVDVFSAGGYQV